MILKRFERLIFEVAEVKGSCCVKTTIIWAKSVFDLKIKQSVLLPMLPNFYADLIIFPM